jgi:hypothetical protein
MSVDSFDVVLYVPAFLVEVASDRVCELRVGKPMRGPRFDG